MMKNVLITMSILLVAFSAASDADDFSADMNLKNDVLTIELENTSGSELCVEEQNLPIKDPLLMDFLSIYNSSGAEISEYLGIEPSYLMDAKLPVLVRYFSPGSNGSTEIKLSKNYKVDWSNAEYLVYYLYYFKCGNSNEKSLFKVKVDL